MNVSSPIELVILRRINDSVTSNRIEDLSWYFKKYELSDDDIKNILVLFQFMSSIKRIEKTAAGPVISISDANELERRLKDLNVSYTREYGYVRILYEEDEGYDARDTVLHYFICTKCKCGAEITPYRTECERCETDKKRKLAVESMEYSI